MFLCASSPSPCDPSSAPGLKPHTQGTGAAGGEARVGGSLDSTPRGVWRRKTPISKTNDVPIAHTNTPIVYREPGGPACACWGLPVKVLPGSRMRVRDRKGYLGYIQCLVGACGVFTVRAGGNREFTFVEVRIVLENKGQEDQRVSDIKW